MNQRVAASFALRIAQLSLASLCAVSTSLSAVIDLGWEPITDLEGLPPSVEVFRSTNTLPGGSAIFATYAKIDLRDPNLEIDVTYVGDGQARITPLQEIENEVQPVYVATNGGFFGSTTSVNPIVDDGAILAFGQQGVNRERVDTGAATTYLPTWGIWGQGTDRVGEIGWSWGDIAGDRILFFEEPYPNSLFADPLPVPQLNLPGLPAGEVFDAVEAMGGVPVLMDDGVIVALSEAADVPGTLVTSNELVNNPGLTSTNPRTAIGISADGLTLYLLVADGRSETSRGLTLPETAEVMAGIPGVYEALNLDGGGSSVMIAGTDSQVITNPSDPEGMRPVAMSLLVKRVPQIFDTEDPEFSRTAGWFPTGNAGFFGDSATLLVGTVEGASTASATYTLPADLPPAEYALGAWWVGSGNRAENTPYTIRRVGFEDVVVLADQTVNSGAFNPLGTYALGPGDTITVSNAAGNSFVAIDAIELAYVGESLPTLTFVGGDAADVVVNTQLDVDVDVASTNSGIALTGLTVLESVDGSEPVEVATFPLTGAADSLTFSTAIDQPVGSTVVYTFILSDDADHEVSETFTVTVLPFNAGFSPELTSGSLERGRNLSFDIVLDTQNPTNNLTRLQVLQSVEGGEAVVLLDQALSSPAATVPFSKLVDLPLGSSFTLTFVIDDSEGNTVTTTRTFDVAPAVGDFTIGFVSDMNGSFGSTTYGSHIIETFNLWAQDTDLVLSSGDMIAGQDPTLTPDEVRAMWAGFNTALYSQLKAATVPFLFTVQNHDAAVAVDRLITDEFWNNPVNNPVTINPGVTFVDVANYPFYYSATADLDLDGTTDVFFVSVDSATGPLEQAQIDFLEATLSTPEAQGAKLRILGAGRPLFTVSNERNSQGFLTSPREPITRIMRELGVDLYYSGDSGAYFPGKRFGIPLLYNGEMAGGGRAFIGESQVPPTSATRLDYFANDPFYGEDVFVFTTYNILNGFEIVDETTLPVALFGFDEAFVMRQDVPVTDQGGTQLSSLNLRDPFFSDATGEATFVINETAPFEGSYTITGSFAGLEGQLLQDRTAIALYRGRHDQVGELIACLEVASVDGFSGTFSGTFELTPETADALAVGYYYIAVRTSIYPEGELRGQLFNDATSTTPVLPGFANVNDTDVFGVRDNPALFTIDWTAAIDPEKSPITYIYELANDPAFTDLLLSVDVGRVDAFGELTNADWRAFLGDTAPGTPVTFYHRIIATDGQNVVVGAGEALMLTKDDSPIDGQVEIPAPNWQLDGIFAQMVDGFVGYDVAIDPNSGRIWGASFSGGGLYVWNPDGTDYILSDPGMDYGSNAGFRNVATGEPVVFVDNITFDNGTPDDSSDDIISDITPTYGVDFLADGTVVLNGNGDLLQLDPITGKALAFRDFPFALDSNPAPDANGRVLLADVFPGNGAWILEKDALDPTTFRDVALPSLNRIPAVARTISFSPEGTDIYMGDAGSSRDVGIYRSVDGLDFTFEGVFEMFYPNGSNAIEAGPDQQMWVINNKGSFGVALQYADFLNNLTYTTFLEDPATDPLTGDIRGFTISDDAKTLYVTDSTNKIVKYVVVEEGGVSDPTAVTLAQVAADNGNGTAQLLGERVMVEATVTTANFASTGLLFYVEDAGTGLEVFSGTGDFYAPLVGERVRLTGTVQQLAGQTSLQVEAVEVLGTAPLQPQVFVTELDESLESEVVLVSDLRLVNPAAWTNSGYAGFTVAVTNGQETFDLYVHPNSVLFDQPAPRSSFTVRGVVLQKDTAEPLFSGYTIMPLSDATAALQRGVGIRTSSTAIVEGEAVNFGVLIRGRDRNVSYQWFVNGLPVDGATRSVYMTDSLAPGDEVSVEVLLRGQAYTSGAVVLPVTPELLPDATNNDVISDITLGFAAYAPWSDAITQVLVDGAPADFTVSGEAIVVASDAFPALGTYTVTVRADGYADAVVEQIIAEVAPALAADATDNTIVSDIVLTFGDDPAWRSAVSAVLVDGVPVDPADFVLAEDGTLTLASSLFPATGTYAVTVEADGYADALVDQTIGDTQPPALNPDTTDNALGQLIEITFAANPAFESQIASVIVDETTLSAAQFTVGSGVIALQPDAFPAVAKPYRVTVEAANFANAVVQQPLLGALPPLFEVDDTNADLVIGFDDPAYGAAIQQVLINGAAVAEADFTAEAAQLTLAAALFETGDSFVIEIGARNYQIGTALFAKTGLVVNQAIADVEVMQDSAPVEIDLAPVFIDPSDPAATLTYTVTGNTNPALLSTGITGTTLTLTLAAGATGEATVTVEATLGTKFIDTAFTVVVFPAPLGTALDIENESVIIGDVAAMDFTPDADSFTLEGWFNASATEIGTIVAKAQGGGSGRQYQIFTFGGEILHNVGGSGTSEIGADYVPNVWNHVALVVDNSGDPGVATLYLNGEEIRTSTPGSATNPGTDVTIGIRRSSGNSGESAAMNGQLDEIRIWNVARTGEEVRNAMHRILPAGTPGLVGYYRFEEGAGTTVADASGNGNDAVFGSADPDDWAASYAAVIEPLPGFDGDTRGAWAAQASSLDPVAGLSIANAQANFFTYTVFTADSATGLAAVETIDAQNVLPAARTWDGFFNGSLAVTLSADLTAVVGGGEALSDSAPAASYVLLFKPDAAAAWTILANGDSIDAGVVTFPETLLQAGLYTIGLIQ